MHVCACVFPLVYTCKYTCTCSAKLKGCSSSRCDSWLTRCSADLSAHAPKVKFQWKDVYLPPPSPKLLLEKNWEERLSKSCSPWNYPFHSIFPASVFLFTSFHWYISKLFWEALSAAPGSTITTYVLKEQEQVGARTLRLSMHTQGEVCWVHYDPFFLYPSGLFSQALLTEGNCTEFTAANRAPPVLHQQGQKGWVCTKLLLHLTEKGLTTNSFKSSSFSKIE